jgi:hypothetical protein
MMSAQKKKNQKFDSKKDRDEKHEKALFDFDEEINDLERI